MKTKCHLACLAVIAAGASVPALADDAKPIEVPGDKAYSESITAGPDGALYVGSLASGGVQRIKPGAAKAEPWIAPGAFGTRSTLGVFADAKTGTLWVCSNDMSADGVPGPGSATGSHLVAFNLATGEGKASYPLPGSPAFCNDMTIAADGTLLVTNSLAPQILELKPGAKELEVWLEHKPFQPEKGVGLDGIDFGSDGNLYVNTFNGGEFFRVEVKDGKAGAVTKLATSRPLNLPDALRHLAGDTFLMAEGSGSLDRVTIKGNEAVIETVKDGLKEPTSFIKVGDTAWVAEGQLSHLFEAKDTPPSLPFEIVPVHIGK
jgi:hypothetical protein